MKAIKRLACTLPLTCVATMAIAAEWAPWPTPKSSTWVGAGFRHDDDSTLVVICDRPKKRISYTLNEPLAHWETGKKITVLVLADDGTRAQPSTGVVINPTQVTVSDQSPLGLNVMAQAKSFFGIGAGGYGRIFPITNLREATTPVLAACGGHWGAR
jgi:hypothetical protein